MGCAAQILKKRHFKHPQYHISFQNPHQRSNEGIIFLFTDKSLSTKCTGIYITLVELRCSPELLQKLQEVHL